MLEKDFYTKVEKPGYLKRVFYGDSVAKYCETVVKWKNDNCANTVTFDTLWNKLVDNDNQVIYQNNKEYIYIENDEIQSMTYDIQKDQLVLNTPEYIMRHHVDTDLIQLKLSNLKSLDVTVDHSLLKYDPESRNFTTMKPMDCNHLPILDNQSEFNCSVNISYFLSGLHFDNDSFLSESLFGKLNNDHNKFLNFFCGYYLACGTYSGNQIILTSDNYDLLNQIRRLFNNIGIQSIISFDENGHHYDGENNDETFSLKILTTNTSIINMLSNVSGHNQSSQIRANNIFYGKGESKTNNHITRISKNAHIRSVKAYHIHKKNTTQYNDYVYDICIPQTQMFIADGCLVHNTDSIFINVPNNNSEDKSIEELWETASDAAENINNLIVDYDKNVLLPRCNLDPENSHLFFKIEKLMSAMLLLEVKKNYAYKLLVNEGVILDPPKVGYVGIQVIKSDTAKFTQDLLKSVIEDVILNEKIETSEKMQMISDIVSQYHKQFTDDIENFEFKNIGMPRKWNKSIQIINGMKLYNQIMNEDVFSSGSAARFIYCKFGIDYGDKTNGICIPYEYDKDVMREKFQAHKINIDIEKQWNTLITTTCKRVFNLAKKLK